MSDVDFEICVIGGGVNGAGIARDAALRGFSVVLLEADDLAGATSSASTKLIHGGLRYLEYFEFDLVRKALKEREILLSVAPHIIWPMDFILPHTPTQRPGWMIRLGLFLYDHLAKRRVLKGSKGVSLKGRGFKDEFRKGFRYSDCWADDSRLVVLNAVDAAQKGAVILTRHVCTKLHAHKDYWDVNVRDVRRGKDTTLKVSMVINAAGPWVRKVLEGSDLDSVHKNAPKVRLVKGSHIVVDQLFEGDEAYILQQKDNRIVFIIPYEGRYTLIGTTEEDLEGDIREASLSTAERDYLIAAHNAFFEKQIGVDDIRWSYSGVRPLLDDGEENATSATRDYRLYADRSEAGAPILSVFGGKLTTYRVLACEAVDKILELAKRGTVPSSTAEKPLPGGDIPNGDFDAFLAQQRMHYDWLERPLLLRYARQYGTRMDVFLSGAQAIKDLGQHFGGSIYEAEIVYLLRYEFVQDAQDVFWRRSKLGLHEDEKTCQNITTFIRNYRLRHGGDNG